MASLKDTEDKETIEWIKVINTGYQGNLGFLLSKKPPPKSN